MSMRYLSVALALLAHSSLGCGGAPFVSADAVQRDPVALDAGTTGPEAGEPGDEASVGIGDPPPAPDSGTTMPTDAGSIVADDARSSDDAAIDATPSHDTGPAVCSWSGTVTGCQVALQPFGSGYLDAAQCGDGGIGPDPKTSNGSWETPAPGLLEVDPTIPFGTIVDNNPAIACDGGWTYVSSSTLHGALYCCASSDCCPPTGTTAP